jgi:hypothetical protein
MQIHEVTLPSEILGKAAQSVAKGAVQGAKNLGQRAATAVGQSEPFQKAKAVLTTPGGLTTARGYAAAIDSVERAKAQKTLGQYQQQIAQQTIQKAKQWAQDWMKQRKSSGMAGTTGKPPPGGMSQGMAASPVGQQLQQIYGAPKGGIGGMKSDLEEVTTTTTPNTQSFKDWAEAQLVSAIPARSGLTMDMVRKELEPKETAALNSLMARIDQNPDDAVAVEQYFETAMQAMQRISAEMKQNRSAPSSGGVGVGQNPFPMIVNDAQFEKIKAWVKGDAVKSAILKKALEIV